MKNLIFSMLILVVASFFLVTSRATGEDLGSVLVATERLEKLRAQLREVRARESELQERIRRLDVDLQPENLQLAINHIATLSADKLRDQLRRQLESEKAKAQEQRSSLTESRFALEKTILEAEIEIARLKARAADNLGTTGSARLKPGAWRDRDRIARSRVWVFAGATFETSRLHAEMHCTRIIRVSKTQRFVAPLRGALQRTRQASAWRSQAASVLT